tara:strand:+ start:971 stop:2065 length:1095 start_codon:yes stop_codon:yes gene_type:complete
MCIIIIKQQNDKKVHKQTLKNSARINPHGLGIVWLDTFETSYHKSKEYNILHTDRPFIAHFRYATVGKVNKENTHPFVCGNNKDELLMMNGTISHLGNDLMCDSKVLAIALGRVKRENWKKELSKYDCRFTTINTRTRTFQMYNKHLWTKKNGIWYSKSNVLMDNLIAVYGTLKKGYSNYNNHLRSSVYLGRGETKEKYPLLVEGLPYMVNKKGVGHNVEVDVFKVSQDTFNKIDRLEGHPRWYKRELVDINIKGTVLSCWVYFNDKYINEHTKLHKTYTQSFFNNNTPHWSNKWNDYGLSKRSMWRDEELETQIDTNTIDVWEEEEEYHCANCFSRVEYDDFNNYYCMSCGNWYTKEEVLTDK